mmetsp:Transcript_24403/g.81115  ORF Transcript_24403/g.81115 Transcript_24403/m.81115 type:complete len:173 (-) Transcript_24403:835-1353(-)
MPTFVLWVKAELEGVKSLSFPFPSTTWTFDVQQAAGSETREGVVMDPEEEVELTDTKDGVANFALKFPGDKRQSYVKFLAPGEKHKELEKHKVKLRAQTADDGDLVPVLAMECRGLEPIKWHPTGPYEAESESGVVFDGVRLDEGDDWCDYDEKAEASMTVGREVRYEIRRL